MKYNYRISLQLKNKKNEVDLTKCNEEIASAIEYFNQKAIERGKPREIFKFETYVDSLVIYLGSDDVLSTPTKAIQLFSQYFIKNSDDTTIGSTINEKDNKVFGTTEAVVLRTKSMTAAEITTFMIDTYLDESKLKDAEFRKKADKLLKDMSELINQSGLV